MIELFAWVLVAQDVAEWIRLLGDDSARARDVAEHALTELPEAKDAVHRVWKETRDPEVKLRAGRLLRAYRFQEILGKQIGTAFAYSKTCESAVQVLKGGRGDLKPEQEATMADELWVLASGEKDRELLADSIGDLEGFGGYALSVRLMVEGSAAIRERVVKRLGWGTLRKMVREPHVGIRRAALLALARGSKPLAEEEIRPCLKDPDPEVRAYAVDLVGRWKYTSSTRDAAELLNDPNEWVQADAAWAMWRLEAREHIPAIAHLLDSRKDHVQQRAIEVLQRFGAKEYAPTIAKLLRSNVRVEATEALASFGSAEFAPNIAALLEDDDRTAHGPRGTAAVALAQLGAKEYVPKIAALLQGHDFNIAYRAVWALGVLDAQDHIPAIAGKLKDGDQPVRWAACEALARLGAKEHVESIAALLEDPDEYVRESAVRALGKFNARDHADRIAARLDEKGQVLMSALFALGQLSSKKHVRRMISELSNLHVDVRWSAALALKQLGVSEGVGELARSTDPGIRSAARWVTGEFTWKDDGAELVRLLQEFSWPCQQRGIWALSQLRGPEPIAELKRAAHNSHDGMLRHCYDSAIRRLESQK
jgi:HEAT repeat protein